MTPRKPPAAVPGHVPGEVSRGIDVAAAAWLILFSLWFYSLDMPNNRPSTRLDVLQSAPFHLLDVIDPPEVKDAPPGGWTGLLQRLPLLLAAAGLAAGAWGWGRLGLRAVGVDAALTRAERFYLAGMLGLTVLSTVTLGLGLLGLLAAGWFWGWGTLGFFAGVCAAWMTPQGASPGPVRRREELPFSTTWQIVLGAVMAAFLLPLVIGSLTPQNDFDVCEYHLGGPKEWLQQGRITFLLHNVYTSFPFLTEMLLLAGMAAWGEWHTGALVGQAVLALYAPLTAVGLYAFGRRWFSPAAGWMSAVVWLSIPWTTRISIIAYAEGGLSAYIFAAMIAAGVALEVLRAKDGKIDRTLLAWASLAGVFAGGAFGCKYPGLLVSTIPVGLALVWAGGKSASLKTRGWLVGVYSAGVLLVAGPWLLKNLCETGNPVYPLAYGLFGGVDWTPADHAKWQHGHPLPHYASFGAWAVDLIRKLQDFVGNNDWHSGLVFAFVPLAWLLERGRWLIGLIALYLGWLFLEWFLLTHHIDRFWVPMLPVASLLAGAGWSACATGVRRKLVPPVLLAGLLLNLAIVTSGLVGYSAGLTDLSVGRQRAAPVLSFLKHEIDDGGLPADFHPLCVGEAALFHAEFPVTYNTVFDHSLFEEWCGVDDPDVSSAERPLKPAEEILATLASRGVTHLYVNWAEVVRYRLTYGYTDFASPRRFDELVAAGVLDRAINLPDQVALAPLGEGNEAAEIRRWAPEQIVAGSEPPLYVARQLFRVRGR